MSKHVVQKRVPNASVTRKARTQTAFKPPRFSPTEVIGSQGAAIYGGWVSSAETNAELVGQRKHATYLNLLQNISIVATGVRHASNLGCKPSWKWEPADKSKEAELIAERVQTTFDNMDTTWRWVIRKAMMYRYTGASLAEWVARKHEEGWITLSDLAYRPLHTITRWWPDEHGRIAAVQQRLPNGKEVIIPRRKLLYLVDQLLTSNPEGNGMLRHVVDPARELQRLVQLEGYSFETDLRGVPIIKAPLEAIANDKKLTAAQKSAKIAAFEEFMDGHVKGPDTGLIMDSKTFPNADGSPSNVPMYGIDFARSDGNGQEPLDIAIRRKTHEIARILGIEGLLIGADGNGSLALVRDKTQSLYLQVDGALDDIGEVMYSDVVVQLGLLNNWPAKLLPRPKIDRLRLYDVEQVAGAIRDAAAAGLIISPDSETWVEFFGMLGMSYQPPSPEDLALMRPASTSPADPDDPIEDDPADDETEVADTKGDKKKPVAKPKKKRRR